MLEIDKAKRRLHSIAFDRAKHLFVPQRRLALVLADRHRSLVSPLSPPHLSRSSKEELVSLGGQTSCLSQSVSPPHLSRSSKGKVVSGEADRLVPRQSVVTAQRILGQQSVCVVLWWNASTKARHTHFLCPSAVV